MPESSSSSGSGSSIDPSIVPKLSDAAEPAFVRSRHVSFINALAAAVAAGGGGPHALEIAATEHLRLTGTYWGLAALATMRAQPDVTGVGHNSESGASTSASVEPVSGGSLSPMSCEAVVALVRACAVAGGGWAGAPGHDAHLLHSLSALQLLALCGPAVLRAEVDAVAVGAYLRSLQRADGAFAGDTWGEVDSRFSYCALQAAALVGVLDVLDMPAAIRYVRACRNFDGGFGAVPGAESHAGQVFCCVGALSIAGALDATIDDADLLGWWLAERQCDSGGLNGRPEKQADVCYSWWVLSALTMLGRAHWIDGRALARFILRCQDVDGGGIADRPGNQADVYHTFFGVAGLALLGDLSRAGVPHADIDPIYALPRELTTALGLPRCTLFIADEEAPSASPP